MKVGINGRNDYLNGLLEEADFRVIREARIEAVKLFDYHRLEVFQRLKAENPDIFLMVRLTGKPGTPAQFVSDRAPRIARLLPYAQDFQVLNEPNLPGEGFGPTDADARRFNDWFQEAVSSFRAVVPQARYGFPGLTPALEPNPTYTDLDWISNCNEAVAAADWLGVHCYFWDDNALMNERFGLHFIQLRRMFPTKKIHVLEFNDDPNYNSQAQTADLYPKFYKAAANYSYVKSAISFIVSSPTPDLQKFGWREESGASRPVVAAVGQIPRPLAVPYDVAYLSHDTPGTMVWGQTSAVTLTLKNSSRNTWRAGGANPIRLGYHWYRTDGSLLDGRFWSDVRTSLPADVPPGGSVTLNATVSAPRLPGAFILRWDLVEEKVTWFAWTGVDTLDVNVAVGSPSGIFGVSASHNNVVEGEDNLLQAIDGDPKTRWSSRVPLSPDMWFQFDLGAIQLIGQLSLRIDGSPNDFPRAFIVSTSADGQSWTPVAENPSNDKALSIGFVPRMARHVKVQQTGSHPSWWWSIHELAVGAGGAAFGQPSASQRNVLSGPDNLMQALDGDPATRWSTGTPQRPGMWFQLDLSSIQTIAQLKFSHRGSPNDYPRGYIVSLSRDGQSWTTVAQNPKNDGLVVATFDPMPARYIKIEQTGSDLFYWWSIHEMAIYDQPRLSLRASHNDTEVGADNLLQAIDGVPATRWSTMRNQEPGMWFEIDLGTLKTIKGLRLDNAASPNDYPRGYVVSLSVDGQGWTKVAENAQNTAPLEVAFASQPARKLKIEQTGLSDRWWWSIHEVIVAEG